MTRVSGPTCACTAPTTYDEALPALMRAGDPPAQHHITPCISCHGQVDRKLGTPWLEGMPKQYLLDQLVYARKASEGE